MGYKESVNTIAKEIPIKDGSFLITGATGLVGSCIVDTLVAANNEGAHFKVYAMSRSKGRIEKRFGNKVISVIQDVVDPLENADHYDYILHCASNADPITYVSNPVETILTNVLGNKTVLDYCKQNLNTRLLLTSTFEVYGQIPEIAVYNEDMSGVIDQTILRNGYPESKRVSELLLKSYVNEYNVNALIARLPSVYGPTMRDSDLKAHAQFIKKALKHEDIILKSEGKQRRTYCYLIDAVSAIFKILFDGNKGEIYNVSNENSVASVAEVAKICAEIAKTKVIFESLNKIEQEAFSKPQDCILDNTKLKKLGWNARYTLERGLKETISSYEDCRMYIK